jgi:hypothetical protein
LEEKMKRNFSLAIAIIAVSFLTGSPHARGQARDLPKFEVATDFTSITFDPGLSEPGLGGRFTYNLNKHVALEAAGYFFPRQCHFCGRAEEGQITQGLFGVKAGKRFKKWGVFGKARPGLMSFSRGAFNIVPTGGTGVNAFSLKFRRQTNLVFDLGGVLEFYPSKKIVLRVDVGDTILRYPRRTVDFVTLDPATGAFRLDSFPTPSFNRRTIQVIAGVGFRF